MSKSYFSRVSGFVLAVSFVLVLSCRDHPNTPQQALFDAANVGPGTFYACNPSDTLDNEQDIADWALNACTGAVLTVVTGTYYFTTQLVHFAGTGCQAATILGQGSTWFMSGDPGANHAKLWFTECLTSSHVSRVQDLILDFSNLPAGKYGLEFEICHAEMDNVTLKGSEFSRLHGVLDFHGTDVTLEAAHTLFINANPSGGFLLENSDLQGLVWVEIDDNFEPGPVASAQVNNMDFKNNTIKDLDVYSKTYDHQITLENNDLAAASGATVEASGNFTVVAKANTYVNATSRCSCEAEDAFLITPPATLDLRSWEYHSSGANDSIWGIPSLTSISSTRDCNTITVTWNTDFVSSSKVRWGYQSGVLPNTAVGNVAASHSVVFTVDDGSQPTIYFEAISGPPGCPADEVVSSEKTNTDGFFTPQITNLQAVRNPQTQMTVTWDTDCEATSKVLWGYSSGNLINTATGADGTSHTVQFNVAGLKGCIYYKAVSENPDDTGLFDESSEQVYVTPIVISNVQHTFFGIGCTVDVTWTTNVKSSTKLYHGTSCGSLTNVVTGPGNTTSHSVTFDATGYPIKTRIYFKVESSTNCDNEQGSCLFEVRQLCAGS